MRNKCLWGRGHQECLSGHNHTGMFLSLITASVQRLWVDACVSTCDRYWYCLMSFTPTAYCAAVLLSSWSVLPVLLLLVTQGESVYNSGVSSSAKPLSVMETSAVTFMIHNCGVYSRRHCWVEPLRWCTFHSHSLLLLSPPPHLLPSPPPLPPLSIMHACVQHCF